MKDALAIHRYLLARGVLHEIVRLPRPLVRATDLPAALALPVARCVVTRLFIAGRAGRSATGRVQHGPLYAVVSGDRPPSLSTLADLLGVPAVRSAPAALINEVTDFSARLVAPLLLPDTVTVLIDQRMVDALDPDEVVYTTTGEPFTALGIRALDLFTMCDGKPVPLGLSR
jgi:prolyl-tRNA editing enzyme YbaK/EbsC (Cys-tRNA(Pro) deacylase)